MSRDEESCITCLYMNETASGEHCGKCTHNYVDWYKPMQNGQRLRAMSNHDLAIFLREHYFCIRCGCDVDIECTDADGCVNMIESWLNNPAENQRSENRAYKTPHTRNE